MTIIYKTCKTCAQDLSLDCFSNGNGKHKKSNVCKECDSIRRKEYHKNLTKEQRQQKAHTQKIRDYKVKYGLPEDIAQKLAYSRVGECEICKKEALLVVDHCHNTGLFRGLLCQQCNSVLGYAKDNVVTLQRAMDYLKEYSNER